MPSKVNNKKLKKLRQLMGEGFDIGSMPLHPLLAEMEPEPISELPLSERLSIPKERVMLKEPVKYVNKIPYSQLKFGNIVEKQQYWDFLPKKYGEGVRNRQNFLDELTRPLDIAAHNEIIEFSDTYMKNMGEFLPKSHPAHKEKNYKFRSESPETRTSWLELLEGRDDIENKPLFFASMMDEGGTNIRESVSFLEDIGNDSGALKTVVKDMVKFPVSGFGKFGLDRIGERIDEFEEKGYLPKGFSERVMPVTDLQNEKDEYVTTSDFYSLDDAITAKNAYMKVGRDNVDQYSRRAKIDLSSKARDFFTLVSYNYGEAGARKMMKYFKDNNLFENDRFLKEEPEDYKQVYRNALRRMQSADMIKGEGFFNAK